MASGMCNISIQRCSRHGLIAISHPKKKKKMVTKMVMWKAGCFDAAALKEKESYYLFVVVAKPSPWAVH